jgi:hypothetical protein
MILDANIEMIVQTMSGHDNILICLILYLCLDLTRACEAELEPAFG